jgi:hypothetical protein
MFPRHSLESLRRIVVYRTGALGDIVVTLPVLATLRETARRAEVFFVAPPAGQLAVMSGYADALLSLESGWASAWFAEDAERMRESLADVDLLIAFTRDDDGVLTQTARKGGVRSTVFHPPLPTGDPNPHIVDHLFSVIGACRSLEKSSAPRIRLNEAAIELGRRSLLEAGIEPGNPFVFLHTGASAPARVWPHVRELAHELSLHTDLMVAVHTGPVEEERRDGEHPARPSGKQIGPFPVPTLAGVLGHAVAYVGSDTGPSHVAAALGIPALTLFSGDTSGRRNSVVWAPRGSCSCALVGSSSGLWPTVKEVTDWLFDTLRTGHDAPERI